ATTLPRPGGRVGALGRALNEDIPDQLAQLDALAAALVQGGNALHNAGTNPAGATGGDLCDPAGRTAGPLRPAGAVDRRRRPPALAAGSVRLSAAVDADAGQIAAGSADGGGNYQSGANDIALQIAALREDPLPALGVSASAYYARLVVDLGARIASASSAAEA